MGLFDSEEEIQQKEQDAIHDRSARWGVIIAPVAVLFIGTLVLRSANISGALPYGAVAALAFFLYLGFRRK